MPDIFARNAPVPNARCKVRGTNPKSLPPIHQDQPIRNQAVGILPQSFRVYKAFLSVKIFITQQRLRSAIYQKLSSPVKMIYTQMFDWITILDLNIDGLAITGYETRSHRGNQRKA